MVAAALIVVVGLSLSFMIFTGGIGGQSRLPYQKGRQQLILQAFWMMKALSLTISFLQLIYTILWNDAIEAVLTPFKNKNLRLYRCNNELQQGATAQVDSVAIPEGSSLEAISQIIADALGIELEIRFSTIPGWRFLFDRNYWPYPELLADVMENDDVRCAEGYLYPATYELGHPPQRGCRHRDYDGWGNGKCSSNPHRRIEASGFTFHEFLTLASLVEAEASSLEDRELIAGVFISRLEIDIPVIRCFSFICEEYALSLCNLTRGCSSGFTYSSTSILVWTGTI